MSRRTIVVDSNIWKVYPAGRVTVYGKDELGLVFELGTGPERKRRFTRYSPLGSRSTDAALAELTDRQLQNLFRQSQPAWTSPESAYGARSSLRSDLTRWSNRHLVAYRVRSQ